MGSTRLSRFGCKPTVVETIRLLRFQLRKACSIRSGITRLSERTDHVDRLMSSLALGAG